MTTSHTPTPWHLPHNRSDPYEPILICDEAGLHVIARISLDDAPVHDYNREQQANAAFIVTACNSHDALVAAADLVLLNIQHRPSKLGEPNWEYLSGLLRDALEKANEPTP